MPGVHPIEIIGKTTLMKAIATLLQVDNGSIIVCGIPAKNAGEIRNIIGYLPHK